MPDNVFAQMIFSALLGVIVYYGVVRPSGMISGPSIIPELRKQERDARIAALECDTLMCDHVVDGEHPRKVVTQYGKTFWRLSDGRMWEVGTDAPDD